MSLGSMQMNNQSKASKSDLPRSLEMKKIFNGCLLHGCVRNNDNYCSAVSRTHVSRFLRSCSAGGREADVILLDDRRVQTVEVQQQDELVVEP